MGKRHGRPQTFFPGEGKIFPGGPGPGGGAAKTYYLPKKHQKDIFLTKIKKHTFLPSPADTHGKRVKYQRPRTYKPC